MSHEGKTHVLNESAQDPQRGMVVAGKHFEVIAPVYEVAKRHDWLANPPEGNYAVYWYALRSVTIALDDPNFDAHDAWYGHIEGLGHIVHHSELGDEVTTEGEG